MEIFLPFAASELFRALAINAKLLTIGEDVKRVYEITISTEVREKEQILITYLSSSIS